MNVSVMNESVMNESFMNESFMNMVCYEYGLLWSEATGDQGCHPPFIFLAYLVILCFQWRYHKENAIAFWPPQNFRLSSPLCLFTKEGTWHLELRDYAATSYLENTKFYNDRNLLIHNNYLYDFRGIFRLNFTNCKQGSKWVKKMG